MICSKTPLRVSFAGGGTDLKSYYSLNAGKVVSMAIDKYIYVIVKNRPLGGIQLSYGEYYEYASDANELQHSITKACLNKVGIETGIQIISFSDVPAGTGLGSSSCFTVGLLNALFVYKNGEYKTADELASLACEIEIDILKAPIGKQDQYACAFGGFNAITFLENDTVLVEPITVDKNSIQNNVLMVYLKGHRAANSILQEQNKNTQKNLNNLNKLKLLADILQKELITTEELNEVTGLILKEGWELKKTLSNGISNALIEDVYDKGIKAGALGGKLLGAGATGFILFYALPHTHKAIYEALKDFDFMPIKLERQGSHIIYE